jgi:two-component system sensor histidine kinase KdpD
MVLSLLLGLVVVAWWHARTLVAQERAARERFVADVAHDLRSPLSVITATAMTLRHGASEPTQTRLDKIIQETQRLTRMLQNRVVAVQVSGTPATRGRNLHREWITVEELAGNALARLDSVLGERYVRLEIGGDVIAHIDARLGEVMIGNLLDNAARYTPAGAAITIRAEQVGTGVQIEVVDAGPGMPAQPRQPRQLPADLARGGGLAVCRAIAAAHRGSLELLVPDGGGTIARVMIPDVEPRPSMAPALLEVS